MAINTYHMTLNTSNVKTPDSWIECNRIGNLVMVNGCVKITKDVNVYTGINLASGAHLLHAVINSFILEQ